MYEQLDIDGNWVKVDDKGNVCPKLDYKIIIKTKCHSFVFILQTDNYVDIESLIPIKLAQVEEHTKDKAREITVYDAPISVEGCDTNFRLVTTYKRLKKFRQLNK